MYAQQGANKFRINRNILECKFPSLLDPLERVHVLIETYWNVNHYHLIVFDWIPPVLIETYWNVNLVRDRQSVNFLLY